MSSRYENFVILGDFNAEPTTTNFCEIYNLKSIIKDKACFNYPSAPTCIDLKITNRPRFFKHSMVVETWLSDFHKMCHSHENLLQQTEDVYCQIS